MENLMIVDGHNLLFRMFYGIPGSIKNSKGCEIKGLIGFIGSLNKLINRISPDKVLIVFDSETSIDSRLDEYSQYKQNRIDYSKVPIENNPFSQLEYIYKVLSHLDLFYIEVQGYEADDYIASICEKCKGKYKITIVSTDRDFLQLVEENVIVFNPRGKEGFYYTPEEVFNKHLIAPKQIIDYKVLVGDKSDNIVGVRNIGPKTAIKILSKGSLSQILAKDCEIDSKLYTKLCLNKEIINRNIKLITMKTDIKISLDYQELSYEVNPNIKTMDLLAECDLK